MTVLWYFRKDFATVYLPILAILTTFYRKKSLPAFGTYYIRGCVSKGILIVTETTTSNLAALV